MRSPDPHPNHPEPPFCTFPYFSEKTRNPGGTKMQREKLQTPQKLKRLKRLRLKRSKELPRFKAPGIWGFLMHKKMARDIKRPRATPLHVDTRRLFHFVYATRVV